MTDLISQLERLGLEQYHDAFVAEGFDTWETLLDIQEGDLDSLGVKLGHRRKLQRAIAEYRGFSSDRPLGSPSLEGATESTRSSEAGLQSGTGKDGTPTQATEAKRKYRRHPKPDENAPEKPPSAYVIFSNRIREEVKGDNLSFTEIARLVGERWQKLDPNEKEPFESQAATQKENYLTQLAEYKKTAAYRDYLQYLADFKAKHGQATESKRPKLDLQSSSSNMSGFGQDNEALPQGPRHTRGGSLGSISTASQGAAMPSPAGIALAPVSSLPNMSASSNRHLGVGGRGNTPPHYPQLPGHLSSQSSVSEESYAARPEVPDPLSRTAALSINTPPTVTPPLPSSASVSGRSDYGSASDMVWAQRHAHGVPSLPSAPSTSSSGRMPTPTSANSDAWRERPGELSRQPFHASGVHPQSSSVPISQLLGSEHGPELSHAQAQRTLPPLRRPPSGPTAPPAGLHGYASSSHSMRMTGSEVMPGQLGQGRGAPGRSENEAAAASVLAGLARRQPGQDSTSPSEHRSS